MKLITRNASLRLAVVLLALTGLVWYMVSRPGRGRTVMTPANISSDALRSHVQTLAGDIGERNVFLPLALARAAGYIETEWRKQGYQVTRQDCGNAFHNLEVTRPGNREIIVIGAHYDSFAGSPGANDNATGIASLLELSRVFAGIQTARTLKFVAFANEEPPFFKTPQQGSRVYARACRLRGDDVRTMIALETMGCFSDKSGSQSYPFPFRLFYPSRGNFVGFVSDLKSRGVMRRAVAAFRAHSDFPVESCATFAGVPGIDWSDHGSFWREGYRAFMVTDTAPYRYRHYHEATDTPDKVDCAALARVTQGVAGAIASLATAE